MDLRGIDPDLRSLIEEDERNRLVCDFKVADGLSYEETLSLAKENERQFHALQESDRERHSRNVAAIQLNCKERMLAIGFKADELTNGGILPASVNASDPRWTEYRKVWEQYQNDSWLLMRVLTKPLAAKTNELGPDPPTGCLGGKDTKETDAPAGQTVGNLGGEELANALGVHPDRRGAFFRQLQRLRTAKQLERLYDEVANPRPNDPKYKYRADSPELRQLAEKYREPA